MASNILVVHIIIKEEFTMPDEKEIKSDFHPGICKAIGMKIAESSMLEMTNTLRVIFRAFLSLFMVAGSGFILWHAAFTKKDLLNEHTGVIVGFITGSALAAVIGFYFGGQDRQKEKKEPLE